MGDGERYPLLRLWIAFSGRNPGPADGREMYRGIAGLYVVGIVGLSGLGGCASKPPPEPQSLERRPSTVEGEGVSDVQVVIQNGRVRAELDRRHEVDQLVAAAEASLRLRGFTVDGHRGRLEEPLLVTGRMGGTPDSRRCEVAILIGPSRVRFDVTIKPGGNDAEGRAVMKRMLELLGYGDGH